MINNTQNNEFIAEGYTLGLDIGIASVGWAVLAEDHIIDLGVRAFNKAETADKGESLNLARRMARLTRRRLNRRASRLKRLKWLFRSEGLPTDWKAIQSPGMTVEGWLQEHPLFISHRQSPWILRAEGLVRRLDDAEWAGVIFHICKHRGFHWISRADRLKDEGGENTEGGKVKKGLDETKRLMKGNKYRTVAEMVLREFPEAQRNKHHEYSKALSRVLLSKELKKLFKRQRKLGNPHAGKGLQERILGNGDQKTGLFWEQKPPLSGANLLKMLGRCTFEKQEYRAPKASFSAERHVWLTKLNNLRISQGGEIRPLNDTERMFVLPLPYQQKSKFTYRQLRRALVEERLLGHDFRFMGLNYDAPAKDGKLKDPETDALVDLKGWQEIRKTLEDQSLKAEWTKLSRTALLEGESALLDRIAWVLSVYKEDNEVMDELGRLDLPSKDKMIGALLNIRFDKFSNLSLKTLRNILPHMARGLRYDEACKKAGYHHSLPDSQQKQRLLPSFYTGRDIQKNTMLWNEEMDLPRNPVVLRAMNQTRKVVNALIHQYGSPQEVHIELARDLSRPLSERQEIEREQKKYQGRNEQAREHFRSTFERRPTGKELEKWLLYKEQQSKCAYSLRPLDLHRVIEDDKYVEIDHVLPWSRSHDNSKSNRVLVLTEENQRKRDRTPYEYLDGVNDSQRWREFKAFVESNKSCRQAKKNRLLRKNFGEKEARDFSERNLNDTRYIARFMKNYIEQYCKLSDGENRSCVVVNGQLTAFLRTRWGLRKVRDESDRHHALDAVVVAACSRSMVQRLADYSRGKELAFARDGLVDFETGEIVSSTALNQLERHFPRPWGHFRDEVSDRLNIKDRETLRKKVKEYGTYSKSELDRLYPIFVSRAPNRRKGGAIHKETIYAQPERLQSGVTQKIPLSALKMNDLDELIDPHRNGKLYAAIRKRLEEHDGDGKKAFPANNPLYKPDKDGQQTGPVVHTVTRRVDKISRIPVRGGIARHDVMLRVDVFSKGGKFYLVPVYAFHLGRKELPDRAIAAHKREEDWDKIDDSFDFLFSLHTNDFVEIKDRKGIKCGYFFSCDRAKRGNQFVDT